MGVPVGVVAVDLAEVLHHVLQLVHRPPVHGLLGRHRRAHHWVGREGACV